MAQIAGGRIGSLKNLKQTLKSSAGPLSWIPKEDGITVRFLTEPEDWFGFYEHWDESIRQSYPCIEDDCPGCATDARRSFRYVANALNVDQDKVIALLLPKDLANRLTARYQKYDTLMDRDYELYRTGEGLDTTYDSTPEAPKKRALAKYKLIDLGSVLQQVWDGVWGDGEDDDEEEEETPRTRQSKTRQAAAKARKPASRKAKVEELDDEDDDLDDEDEDEDDEPAPRSRKAPAKKAASKPAPRSRRKPVEDDDEDDEDDDLDDDDDLEDEDDDMDEDDGDLAYSEDELEGYSLAELREAARDFDIATTKMKRADLIEAIIEAQE